MSTAELDIFEAGMALIRDIPQRPPTAWPNVKDRDIPPTPATDNDPCLWWDVRWFPNENSDPLWDDGPVRRVGFFQVLVHCRPNFGTAALTEAQRVIQNIPKGSKVASVVVSKQPWMAPAIDGDDWSMVPVTIPYDGMVF